MHDAIIDAEGLVKVFGKVRALDGLTLTVPPGGIYGLLGPNGAGKTTLIRVLTTLLEPDAGSARVAGVDVRADPAGVRARIGLAGQSAAVDEVLTGRENVEMVGRLYGLPRREARHCAQEVLERIHLAGAADRPVKTYSGGMRLVGTGTTVLLTTQYLEEADQLADRIAVVDHGRLVGEGTGEQLKDRVGGAVVELRVPASDHQRTLAALRGAGMDPTVDEHTGRIVLGAPDGPRTLTEALRRLDAQGINPADATLRKPTLDDVFLALTGHRAARSGSGPDLPARGGHHRQARRAEATR